MNRKSNEPFLWALFGAGGAISAIILPVLILLFGILIPSGALGEGREPSYGELLTIVQNPVIKILLFGLIFLSLFHWAHRFRFTLYDGLQIKHLNELIAFTCYGGAALVTIYAGYLLYSL